VQSVALNTNSVPKHFVMVHPTPFKHQPKSEMGKITNDLKRSYSEPLPITKILDLFAKGHCILLSNAEVDHDNRFRFISSSVFAIDIDDKKEIFSPEEVLFTLKDKLSGLFYTFSHGIEGNRYRLVFQLDRSVNDELKMKGIIELINNDLKALGLPVDSQAKNPLQVVRGGKAFVLVSESNKLNTNELLERVQQENKKRQQDLYKEFEKELRPVPFKELKTMAETVGHIPSGSGQGELWKRLVVGIKHYKNTGHITDEEGFELYDIISGGEQSQRSWETLRAHGQATIKSLIYEAQNKGYKGKYTYYGNDEPVEETYEKEIIKVKQYVPTEIAKEILCRNQRILVDSSTGSGKTTSFLNAFKELESDRKHFYIFATPTIALTLQNAGKHNIMSIKGQTKNLFPKIFGYVKSGRRAFISTYDMAPFLIEILRSIEKHITFTLVVDEMHKFITDYDLSYRYEAIKNLYEVSKKATSFIGLSGTIDDIYKNEFERVITIDNNNPQSPCQEVAVYTYEKKANAMVELVQLIEVWTKKRKLLIYIQSKRKIEQLKKILRRKGITVRTINANSKSNTTYKQLIEGETIDPNVQVLLTTSVIADGVNIQNDMEWEVIAVCNEFSNLFNYSSIKQISNRLRNPYRRFSIYMQQPKNTDQQLFKLENAYNFRLGIAERITKEINEHPYFDPRLFRTSIIERRYGIYQGTEGLEIDTLFLRHAVSKEQERYFHNFRLAFIRAVEKALHKKSNEILNITKEIESKRLDLTFTQEILKELEEQELQEQKEKTSGIKAAFTEEVYKAFLQDKENTLEEFKEQVAPMHYSCLYKLTKIADYQSCFKIVSGVKRDADTHAFYNRIRYLTEGFYLMALNRPNKTKNVLQRLLNLQELISNHDYEKRLEKIAKQTRTTKKDVKEVEKMIQFETQRNMKERFKRVTGLITVESIAEEFNLPVETVKKIALNYAKTKGEIFETIVKSKLYFYDS
jgi:hypothetical protein